MKWRKLGLLFKPGKYTWMSHQTFISTVDKLEDSIFKIYFAGRDKDKRGRIGYTIIDMKEPRKILEISENPILELGRIGLFDDCGMLPCSIVNYKNKKYLYYYAITLAVTVPWKATIGLAISNDNGKTYEKFSEAPIFNINPEDPYGVAQPWVVLEDGIWQMWYVTFSDWKILPNETKPKHYFHIKYAKSKDGINWQPTGIVCISYKNGEYAITRPIVYKKDKIYRMLYCYRGNYNTYRIGYAESPSGTNWKRMDHVVGIDVSEDGWDSEMVCHAFPFEYNGNMYMVYNGNGYGSTGTGLAVLEKE